MSDGTEESRSFGSSLSSNILPRMTKILTRLSRWIITLFENHCFQQRSCSTTVCLSSFSVIQFSYVPQTCMCVPLLLDSGNGHTCMGLSSCLFIFLGDYDAIAILFFWAIATQPPDHRDIGVSKKWEPVRKNHIKDLPPSCLRNEQTAKISLNDCRKG